MSRIRIRVPASVLAVLPLALLVLSTRMVHAQRDAGREVAAAPVETTVPAAVAQTATEQAEQSEDAETISLNFFNATWPQVLERLAEQSDSTLVGSRAPTGRFNRRDRKQYTRTQAVQILNRELAPQKFRLQEEGRFLVVLDLDSLRARYRRPELPVEPAESASQPEPAAAEQNTPAPRAQVADVTPSPKARAEQRAATPNPRLPEQRTSAASPVHHAAGSAHRAATGRGEPAPVSSLTVPVRRLSARDAAATVYRTLKSRSHLVEAGPLGLPAFVVRPATGSAQQPGLLQPVGTVELDSSRGALVVTAGAVASREMSSLIRQVDQHAADPRKLRDTDSVRAARHSHPAGAASSLQLVNFPGATARLAGRMQFITGQLQRTFVPGSRSIRPVGTPSGSGRQAASSPAHRANSGWAPSGLVLAQRDGGPAAGQPPRPAPAAPAQPPATGSAPGAGTPPGNRPPAGRADLPALIESLRGDVSVEALQELGVLILRGNQADVDAVMKVIRQLELLGQGAVPEIHLLLLEHVNSESLATLLTSIYDELASVRTRGSDTTRRVSVLPVVQPNAVLIIASAAEMEAVLELASELDRPVDPETELEVFSLRYAVAEQVLTMLESFYEERPGLGTRIRIVADARTNSVVVQGRPNDLAEVAAVIRRIDRAKSGAVSRLQIIPLKHAVADELVQVLNNALLSVLGGPSATTTTGGFGGNTGAAAGAAGSLSEELRQGKSSVLEFLATDGQAQKLLRSGLLADIRITSDPRTNSLLVTAPDASGSLMRELVRQLDRPATAVAEIKVFTLANSDAAAMVPLLESLFQQSTDQGQAAVQLAGAEAAGSGLIPLRFSVDPRTNSIIASGGAESLQIVEAVLLRLDESDIRQRRNTVIKLKNSPVTEVAAAINEFLTSQRDLAQVDPELVSSTELLEREIIVVPEAVSNSLLISATPRYYEEILRLVSRLDEPPAQVIIQALLVEVELQNTDEFGVELGFQDSVLFDRSLTAAEDLLTIAQTNTSPNGVQTTTQQIVSQAATPGFLFNNQPLGNNINANPSDVGTQGLSNFSLGRVNGDLGFGGLVLSASSQSVSVLLRALAAQRTVHILSRPQIRTLDNQLAQIQVGQQVPVVDGVTVTATGITNPLIRQDNAGIILTVTPRISPDGTIVMETVAEKSQFSGAGVPIFTDATTGNVIESPIKDITTARATVAVPNGQTIVLGGMITKTDDTLERKIPWFGDLPLLGKAFRYDGTSSRRTELLIFLTPRIIRHSLDSEFIKQVEIERMHFLMDEAEAMHGPILAAPADPLCTPGQFPHLMGTELPGGGPAVVPSTDHLPGSQAPPPSLDGPQMVPGADQPLPPGLFNSVPPAPGPAAASGRAAPAVPEAAVPTTRMTKPSLPAADTFQPPVARRAASRPAATPADR